jgi:hypothetical protein
MGDFGQSRAELELLANNLADGLRSSPDEALCEKGSCLMNGETSVCCQWVPESEYDAGHACQR